MVFRPASINCLTASEREKNFLFFYYFSKRSKRFLFIANKICGFFVVMHRFFTTHFKSTNINKSIERAYRFVAHVEEATLKAI